MIYRFPDLDTLRLALTSGAVPPAVALTPVRAGFTATGILIESSKAIPKKAAAELRRLGVAAEPGNGPWDTEAANWLQLFPLVAEAIATKPTPQTPILFDLTDAGQFPALVGEMLRLGNDRQAFRVLTDGSAQRVLLRVIGPPYYSLLRALDQDATSAAPAAYVERRMRIWVRLGFTHPLVETITAAPGQLLLLDPPRGWTTLTDGPFRDIYEILEFELPRAAANWQPGELERKLSVPLKLAASGSSEAAELWVVAERAIEQFDNLVSELDNTTIARLAFAVVQRETGGPLVVVKVRPSKQAPPVLVLDAVGYRPYLKLPNLFLPVGQRLRPPLRRDAVRKLLASDAEQVVWLSPEPDGRFVPQQLPDAAFQPLADWVDYVLDHDHEALTAWMQSTRFDFAPFICQEESPQQQTKPPVGKRRSREKAEPPELPRQEAEGISPAPAPPPTPRALVRSSPSNLQQELAALEKEFLDLPGPLDRVERHALWPRLAELNAALERYGDAAACWLHGIWEQDSSQQLIQRWFEQEGEHSAIDVETVLADDKPALDALRYLAAAIVQQQQWQPAVAARLRQYLEKHEAQLGIRPLWLAWLALAKDDALGLARARDRILDRLLVSGLSGELDLPSFLRFERGGDRFRMIHDRLLHLHLLARDWSLLASDQSLGRESGDTTIAYLDLMFAYGFARLGESTNTRDLLGQAAEVLSPRDEVHSFLYEAFSFRITRALEGQAGNTLPPDLLAQLERLSDPAYKERDLRYLIDRLRQRSRILEPQESVDPYARSKADEIDKRILAWSTLTNGAELVNAFRKDWKEMRTVESRRRLVVAALRMAPRIGTDLTVELLGQVVPLLDSLPAAVAPADLQAPIPLLERALFLAAHHDLTEFIPSLVEKYLAYLDDVKRMQGTFDLVESVTGQSLRGLRKLGLRDQAGTLLERLTDLVFQDKSLEELQQELGAERWSLTMVTLLHLAAGWADQGNRDPLPVIDAARSLLLDGTLDRPGKGFSKMKVARAYVGTLAWCDTELALSRVEELFERMGGFHEIGTFNSHYLVLQLQFVEAVVLALVSDEFTMGQTTRRWLDEDEYLVRRRVHADVRRLLG